MKNINIRDSVEISPSVTGKEDWNWTRATVLDKHYCGSPFEWVIVVKTDDGTSYNIDCADDTKIKRLNEFTLKLPNAMAKEVQMVFDAIEANEDYHFERMRLESITKENVIREDMALVRLSSCSSITPDALFWLGHECAIYGHLFKENESKEKKTKSKPTTKKD